MIITHRDTLPGDRAWYFAYGANLATHPGDTRSALISVARPAFLKNFRIAFNRAIRGGGVYANIVLEPGGIVWGVAYRCEREVMMRLDKAERAIGRHYRRMLLQVETAEGEMLEAETCVAGNRWITKSWRPSNVYLSLMINGARQHGLPEHYIEEIKMVAANRGEEKKGYKISCV